MGFFRKEVPSHLVPIHRDNVASKDWVVLLEASTIIGPSSEKLRVAQTTQERKIVKKYNFLFRAKHYLVVDGHDPRIHAVYYCPQLYKYNAEKNLVPLQGEEIGALIARALEGGIKDRQPWYEPSERFPSLPVVNAPLLAEYDTLVVETPKVRSVTYQS